MKNFDITAHIMGNTRFIDDISCGGDLLHAVLYLSKVSKGKIINIDTSEALKSSNVVAIITYKDIPGINQIGHIFKDQPLLAEGKVEYTGEPIAIIVAKDKNSAYKARKLIHVDIEEENPITDPRESLKKGIFIQPSRRLEKGDINSIWDKCDIIVEDTVNSAGQEHFYLETQSALVIPKDDGGLKIYASSQSPTGIQKDVSEVVDLPMNKIEVDILKIGGGFGGKEACAMYAAFPAVAAKILAKPVKLVLSRADDMALSSKRHPFTTDFKIGLDKNNKILAYQAKFLQDAGAYADISPPVLERCMLHAVNSYNIPNVLIDMFSCKTNKIPNTAFRGFGVPQSFFAIECAIYKAAEKMNIHPYVIQKDNLLKEGDTFHYGMKTENCNIKNCWDKLNEICDIDNEFKRVDTFNSVNTEKIKGLYIMPISFGISFAQTILNQAGALVHIYTDGTVSVSTGAVDMGQGVNTKIKFIVARALSVKPDKVRVETTNTTRVANISPTAASTGCDLNGMAAKNAASQLIERLKKVVAEETSSKYEQISIKDEVFYCDDRPIDELKFVDVVGIAYRKRVDLTCHAYYATPGVMFDRVKEVGTPFPYHSYGASMIEITIDCLKGTYNIDFVKIVHDVGESISKEIDKGQFEGGVVQGIGWSTIENLVYDKNGKLASTTSSYKIPDIKFIPDEILVELPDDFKNPKAVYNSKAVGEPPFVHGLGAYFALLYAIRNYRKDKKLCFSLPLTPEKVFMYIHGK